MKVMITGATGFIGARLVDAAVAAWGSDNVIAFSSRQIAHCRRIAYGSANLVLDDADKALIESVDVLIHVGAYIPKSRSEANAIEACNGNIVFTEQLLGLPFNRLSKVIYISTVDVYAQADLISESTPAQPATLYGWSKLYCEQMISVFAAQKKIVSQILRIGHVYGPGEEKYAKFLPKAIHNIVEGKAVELWGDGSELRSFIYVDDVVKAILAAVALQDNVGVINVVSDLAISIRQVLDELIAISGKPVELDIREFNGPKRDYVFDATKRKANLMPDETDFAFGLRAEYAYMENLR